MQFTESSSESQDKAMDKSYIKENLICPICHAELSVSENGKSIACSGARRHLWDIASSGYVNIDGSSKSGDPKDAVRARTAFLSLGHYSEAAKTVLSFLEKYAPGGVYVDAGCGEGYYSQMFAGVGKCLFGFDLSRAAVEKAAKRKTENAFFILAGINRMPVGSSRADAVINIFAPCFEDEYTRILKDGGVLIVMCAGKNHLMEMKKALYDETPENTLRADLPQNLTLIEKKEIGYTFTLRGRDEIESLFAMTPYSYRTERSAAERLLSLDSLTVTANFEFYVYKK